MSSWPIIYLLASLALLAGPIAQVPGQAAPPSLIPDHLDRVSETPSFVNAIDVHRDQVAWASPANDSIEMRVANLTTGEEDLVTAISDPDSQIQIESLAFDGTWIVWSDDRFGGFELFAVDIEDGRLVRLTDDGADDLQPDVSEGRVVWARDGDLRMAGLPSGTQRVFFPGVGPSPSPAIEGDRVAWAHSNGTERYVLVSEQGVPSPLAIHDDPGVGSFEPATDGDRVVSLGVVLRTANGSIEGVEGAVVQFSEVEVDRSAPSPRLVEVNATNLTGLRDISNAAIGGGHVGWMESSQGATRTLYIQDVGGDHSGRIQEVLGRAQLSATHLLVLQKVDGESGPRGELLGEIHAGAWGAPGVGGGSGSSGSATWVLAAGGIALLVIGLAWKPVSERIGKR